MPKKVLLELENVTRTYMQAGMPCEVLHGINLKIYQGQMVAIVGPSGSGKSTLMNILGCLDKPSTGAYKVDGVDTKTLDNNELAKLRRDFFGFIFQRYHLLGHLSASENVQVPMIYAGVSHHKREQRAAELLSSLGLSHRINFYPNQLSGGQQQRVSIARALANGGQIILADEPTGALDSKSGQDVLESLKQLNQRGHTIIIVTHDINIAKHARRIITIEDGKIKSDLINEPQIADSIYEKEFNIKSKWANSLYSITDRFKESFKMALVAMIANRMRTLLTMLGIIIGIMAVISVVALGQGASNKIIENISSLGTNTISVYPGKRMGDVHSGRVRTLNSRDLLALKGQPFVDSASPSIQTSVLMQYGANEYNGIVYGVNAEAFRVSGFSLQSGRLFNDYDINSRAQVGVIDQNTKDNFFKNTNPIGKVLLVNSIPIYIIGVLKKIESPMMRPDQLQIYLPYTSVSSRIINQDYLSSIVVRVNPNFSTAVAETAIVNLIKSRHGTDDFFISSTDAIIKSIKQTTLTFTILISAIAVISLLVGGIGVMNIMLVSVTERTREIGIRMAVGAKESDIMSQFLIEAVLVCVIGGFIGVLLAFILGLIVENVTTNIYMSFSLISIIAAVFTSSAIGIVFGFVPAKNAARLDPIESLSRD